MSQAANTFWVNRVNAPVRTRPAVKKGNLMHRVFDSIVLAVILAACGLCISYYLRTRAEFSSALNKQQAAGERVAGLTGEVERLEGEVRRLRADAKAFEELARHKFGFVGAGDVVIKLAQTDTEAINPPVVQGCN